MLTSRGVPYEAVNVESDAEGLKQMLALGTRSLPIVARGDRFVIGMDLRQVEAFLALPAARTEILAVDLLVDRITRILAAALRFGPQIPPDKHAINIPGRARSYLALFAHILGHAGRFAALTRAPEKNYSAMEDFSVTGQPPENATVADLVEFGARVRSEILDWHRTAANSGGPASAQASVMTFYGPQTLHQLLDSNTYSVAQHTRQLQEVLRMVGVMPEGPLAEADLADIELPKGLWDEV